MGSTSIQEDFCPFFNKRFHFHNHILAFYEAPFFLINNPLNGRILRGKNGLAGEIKYLPFDVDWDRFDYDPERLEAFMMKTIQAFQCIFNPDIGCKHHIIPYYHFPYWICIYLLLVRNPQSVEFFRISCSYVNDHNRSPKVYLSCSIIFTMSVSLPDSKIHSIVARAREA